MTRLGIYRRAINLSMTDNAARGEMEDDAHHFGVTLRHDGHQILEAEGEAIRTPWTICPGALDSIQRFVGLKLDLDNRTLAHDVGAAEQCTHMFDLASLLMRHACRGTRLREYRITLPIDDLEAPRPAILERDGTEVLRWLVADQTITGPAPYSGLDLKTVNAWARANLADPDEIEAVTVLRRAAYSSLARTMDLDKFANATPLEGRLGPCHVFRPGHIEKAERVIGSTIDFSAERWPLSHPINNR